MIDFEITENGETKYLTWKQLCKHFKCKPYKPSTPELAQIKLEFEKKWGGIGEKLEKNWGGICEELEKNWGGRNWGRTGEELGKNWGRTGEEFGKN